MKLALFKRACEPLSIEDASLPILGHRQAVVKN